MYLSITLNPKELEIVELAFENILWFNLIHVFPRG